VSRLTIEATALAGVMRVRRERLRDGRGAFERLFCAEELCVAGWLRPVAQVNRSVTVRRGTVRGLHCQWAPHAEMKLVSCMSGEVWDVAVDLRAGSPTFLRWHAERLSADNGVALLVPEGCAHGFQTLSDDAELLYCHSAPYVAAAEGGVHPQDPRLAIAWPLPVEGLSARDAAHAPIGADFRGVDT
jgi:dTDP-4-dehydrorhamnose 3,5-epimerase